MGINATLIPDSALPEALTYLPCPGCGAEWTDDSFNTSDSRCPACHGVLTCDVCGALIAVDAYEPHGLEMACVPCHEAAAERLRDQIEGLIWGGFVVEATAAVQALLDRSPTLRARRLGSRTPDDDDDVSEPGGIAVPPGSGSPPCPHHQKGR